MTRVFIDSGVHNGGLRAQQQGTTTKLAQGKQALTKGESRTKRAKRSILEADIIWTVSSTIASHGLLDNLQPNSTFSAS